jgi:hypothetical protein
LIATRSAVKAVDTEASDLDWRQGTGANQWRVGLTMATSDNMTGTSTSTPTMVDSAAPEFRPNREMATATASSKKLDS